MKNLVLLAGNHSGMTLRQDKARQSKVARRVAVVEVSQEPKVTLLEL